MSGARQSQCRLAARAVGAQLWVEAFPATEDQPGSWYMLDLNRARVIGQISIPRGWRVLGGAGQSVLVLRRDEFDVEVVAVHDIQRANQL